MPQPRIVVTNRAFPETIARLEEFATVEANGADQPWARAELLRRCAEADGLLAFMTDHVDAAFLDACPRLRAIGCALKGADNFDQAACAARGVALSVVPDLLTVPTAELAIGLMLALGRQVLAGDAAVRGGGFEGWRPILYGTGLAGTTVGILGMGAVGRAIAARLAGFGCRLLYTDDAVAPPPATARRTWPALLAESDWLVLAAPLTPASLHLVDAAALAAMRPGALLVNIARGSLVDEAAVAAALAAGRLGGYAADVFEMEDWARPDRPRAVSAALLAQPRTVFTPHLGSAVAANRRRIELAAAEALAGALGAAAAPGQG